MSKQGYIPKDLHFDSEGREKLIKGITKISKAVKSTLGPRGKSVLIESPDHLRGITITKDGVTVAKEIELEDKFQDLGAQMVKEVASKMSPALLGVGWAVMIFLILIAQGTGEQFIYFQF